MKVITAPEYYAPKNDEITVFLAGGITDCPNWQKEVITRLYSLPAEKTEHLVIFNPRRDEWPDNVDKEEIRRQINWEADYICQSDIFSMYFTNTEKSDQPICFYELGRYTGHFDIVSYQYGFKRDTDVDCQLELIFGAGFKVNKNITPIEHADIIFKRYLEEYDKLFGDYYDEEERYNYKRPRGYRGYNNRRHR